MYPYTRLSLIILVHLTVTTSSIVHDNTTMELDDTDDDIMTSVEDDEPPFWPLHSTDKNITNGNNEPPVTTSANNYKHVIRILTRQLMMQQLAAEEKSRSDGDSGIKQVRHGTSGTQSYYAPSHVGTGPSAIHDHANYQRTIGMGELVAVLNGVEFRTRHNDHIMVMPHRTSSEYHAVEEIPLPTVPPEVSRQRTVPDQIVEMREWFKAWKNQDYSKRDYRKYFKPVLCYLEGAWTFSKDQIDEPFASDRHFIDANTWYELQERLRFTTYTGKKSALENYAYLPTKIMGITDEGLPILAQWNYRILCQPLKRDLPLNRFRLVEDLKSRLSRDYTYEEFKNERSARFSINQFDSDDTDKDDFIRYGLLDELMREIPGKDNHQGNITDTAFAKTTYDLSPQANATLLNAAFYHRWTLAKKKDAMGSQKRKNGFSDDNLYVALTEQERVAGRSVSACKGRVDNRICGNWTQKVSYAIPLEIVYMTPLSLWNPYNLSQKGRPRSPEGRTVKIGKMGKRNGRRTPEKAFNGTNDKLYFLTPVEFFKGREINPGAADTSRNSIAVLDQNGTMRLVRASGHRIIFPTIEGVGVMRQRFPIMPVHAEGSAIWKELDALRTIVMNPKKYAKYFHEQATAPETGDSVDAASHSKTQETGVYFEMQRSRSRKTTSHKHTVHISDDDYTKLRKGEPVTVETSENNMHSHKIQIRYVLKQGAHRTRYKYMVEKCDMVDVCWDGHGKTLSLVKMT